MATLIYSRINPNAEIYDRRVLHFDNMGHKSTYVNGFAAVAKVVCRQELDEARRRVSKKGKWHTYDPSAAWRKKINHNLTNKTF